MIRILRLVLLSIALFGCGGGGGGGSSDPSTDACSTIGLSPRIVNGTICSSSPAAVVKVNLAFTDGTSGLCTGTMISSRDVLTAAHCFLTRPVGVASISFSGRQVSAGSVDVHPGAVADSTNLAYFNDVAVLHLSRSVSLPVLPIVLSRSVERGDLIDIFGFGQTDVANTQGVLRSGQMAVTSVTPNHIFADFSGSGSNTCFGDSGGPAMISFINTNGQTQVGLVGVVSTGRVQSCGPGDLSLFANLQTSSIIDFIEQVVPGVGVV